MSLLEKRRKAFKLEKKSFEEKTFLPKQNFLLKAENKAFLLLETKKKASLISRTQKFSPFCKMNMRPVLFATEKRQDI